MATNPSRDLASPDVIQRCADWLVERAPHAGTTLLGISGAQGSGKTTLTQHLARHFLERGVPVATLALDDFYLPKAERARLARERHPLFATRGVPGTHEVALLADVLTALGAGRARRVPVFDKARDDRLPLEHWREIPANEYRFVFLEGWCVGLPAQEEHELDAPLNELEAREDSDARWRRAVNAHLVGDYRELFGRLDLLLLLLAPSFDIVYRWRAEQEADLKRAASGPDTMGPGELTRFIMHFERLTRHALRVLPRVADVVVELDRARRVLRFAGR